MGREGFEPSKAVPADLQSVPFGHSGICPLKPMNGLEPLTCWLQISCSANWATSAYEFLLLRAARKLRFLARDAIAYTMKTSTSRQCKHSCVWCFHRARNLYSAKIEPHRRIHFYHLYFLQYKWDLQGSNLWPPACKADALPAELRSQEKNKEVEKASLICFRPPLYKLYIILIATRMGFEPTTSAVTGRRSNQLSHRAIKSIITYSVLNYKYFFDYTLKTTHWNPSSGEITPLSFLHG